MQRADPGQCKDKVEERPELNEVELINSEEDRKSNAEEIEKALRSESTRLRGLQILRRRGMELANNSEVNEKEDVVREPVESQSLQHEVSIHSHFINNSALSLLSLILLILF